MSSSDGRRLRGHAARIPRRAPIVTLHVGVVMLAANAAACGGPRSAVPREHARATRPPVATSTPPRSAVAPACDQIEALVHRGAALAAYGAYPSRLSIVRDGAAFRVFYPRAYDDPLASASMAIDGALGPAERASVELGAEPHRVARPTFASLDGMHVMAAGVFVDDRDADIVVAIGRTHARFGTAAPVFAQPALDLDPAIAPGPDRGFGVAWRHGAYPNAPDIAFARIDRNGRTLGADVVVRDANAGERLALVHVPGAGWAFFYATLGTERDLVLVRVAPDGRVIERRTVASGGIADPVAAWDGVATSVAYHVDATGSVAPDGQRRSGVGWLRFDAAGRALGGQVVVDEPEEPSANPTPSALIVHEDACWLATIVSFPTVIVDAVYSRATRTTIHRVHDEPPHASLVRIDREGRPRARVTLAGVSTITWIATPTGPRGALIESALSAQGALRTFTARCIE